MLFLRCLLSSVLNVFTTPSALKIIAHDPAENEPRCSHGALQRTADFRFPDARMIAHRNFNDAESGEDTFHDHFHRPSVGGLFERECAKRTCASGPKRPEVRDLQTVEKMDQARRHPISESGMPG